MPTESFKADTMVGTDAGSTTMVSCWNFVAPKERSSKSCWGSTSKKPVAMLVVATTTLTSTAMVTMAAVPRSHPHDDDRAQGNFGQGVENDQVGVGDLSRARAPPQPHGGENAQSGADHKAQHCFVKRHADVQPQLAALGELQRGGKNARGRAEDEAVDPAELRSALPQKRKEQQNEDPAGR